MEFASVASSQGVQVPPQSTPVSSPFITPSSHVGVITTGVLSSSSLQEARIAAAKMIKNVYFIFL